MNEIVEKKLYQLKSNGLKLLKTKKKQQIYSIENGVKCNLKLKKF